MEEMMSKDSTGGVVGACCVWTLRSMLLSGHGNSRARGSTNETGLRMAVRGSLDHAGSPVSARASPRSLSINQSRGQNKARQKQLLIFEAVGGSFGPKRETTPLFIAGDPKQTPCEPNLAAALEASSSLFLPISKQKRWSMRTTGDC